MGMGQIGSTEGWIMLIFFIILGIAGLSLIVFGIVGVFINRRIKKKGGGK